MLKDLFYDLWLVDKLTPTEGQVKFDRRALVLARVMR
jgi:hypothetical protein